MRIFSGLVTEFSKVLDKLAGFCLVLLVRLAEAVKKAAVK
jgi:hypothetical protein